MKLLLVDDDAFIRDMYSLKFTEAGFTVVSAENGVDALRLLERERDITVALVDMILPGLSGIELIQAIKARFSEREVKCIVLSNQGQPEEVADAKRLGAIGYIIKAETVPSQVVNQVKQLINL